MPRILEGNLAGQGIRVGIVVARFNEFITSRLLEGAVHSFGRHGVNDGDVTIAWVPGSFEIGLIAKKMAESGNYDVIVALGCIIRGATSHYDYVASQTASGVAQAAMQTGVPVIFGVLTVDTQQQALDRIGGKEGHKGEEAADTAIETARLLQQI